MSGLRGLLPKPRIQEVTEVDFPEDEYFTISDTLPNNISSLEVLKSRSTVSKVLKNDQNLSPEDLDLYQVVVRAGHSSDRAIQSRLADMMPKKLDQLTLTLPSPDQIQQEAADVEAALQKIVLERCAKTQTKSAALVAASTAPKIVRYTPKATVQQPQPLEKRTIHIVSTPVDPLEPPKFRHKRAPKPPPSPPVPRLHSPPRKNLTAAEQRAWNVPPCVSRWTNPKGYTVPLDKRLASDGKSVEERTINPRIADFAEALYVAERSSREEVELRAAVERKAAEHEQRQRDEQLRLVAEKARLEARKISEDLKQVLKEENRYQRRHRDEHHRANFHDDDRVYDSYQHQDRGLTVSQRERIRKEREYERERELRLSRMSAEQRARFLSRESDRDISERIALGGTISAKDVNSHKIEKDVESIFDQRLFDQTSGISSGFGGAAEGSQSIYDRPLFGSSNSLVHNLIYRPHFGFNESEDETIDDGSDSKKSKTDHTYSGSKRIEPRAGPVLFEKRNPLQNSSLSIPANVVDLEDPKPFAELTKSTDDDPFGVRQFLSEAKKGNSR